MLTSTPISEPHSAVQKVDPNELTALASDGLAAICGALIERVNQSGVPLDFLRADSDGNVRLDSPLEFRTLGCSGICWPRPGAWQLEEPYPPPRSLCIALAHGCQGAKLHDVVAHELAHAVHYAEAGFTGADIRAKSALKEKENWTSPVFEAATRVVLLGAGDNEDRLRRRYAAEREPCPQDDLDKVLKWLGGPLARLSGQEAKAVVEAEAPAPFRGELLEVASVCLDAVADFLGNELSAARSHVAPLVDAIGRLKLKVW